MATGDGDERLYVWAWLPGAGVPVVCGALDAIGDRCSFTYAQSYLRRTEAVSLFEPELPLRAGRIDPSLPAWEDGVRAHGCIRDAGPDSWGRRVIEARGRTSAYANPLLRVLAESGSDRIGALDFQASPTDYVARRSVATLDDLAAASELIESGDPLPAALSAALLHGTSVGGARPKALLDDGGRRWVAKFSLSSDLVPMVRLEAAALALARECGIDVPDFEMRRAGGRDALLVERFDRTPSGTRRAIVSALTILGETDLGARYATYPDLADEIRRRFTEPAATLRELFARIVFNVAIGNTDDHARNHAAFWDGRALTLTPAYDLVPWPRLGNEAAQAMAIDRHGNRSARFAVCVDAAAEYLLDRAEATAVVERTVTAIRASWPDVADRCRLTARQRATVWERAVLNPSIFD